MKNVTLKCFRPGLEGNIAFCFGFFKLNIANADKSEGFFGPSLRASVTQLRWGQRPESKVLDPKI